MSAHPRSLAEAVIAVTVEVLVWVLALTLVVGASRSAAATAEAAAGLARIARLDRLLVATCRRIHQPLVPQEPTWRASDSHIAIAYVDGDPDAALEVEWTDRDVSFTVDGRAHRMPGITLVAAHLELQPVPRLIVSARHQADARVVRIEAPLGGAPLE